MPSTKETMSRTNWYGSTLAAADEHAINEEIRFLQKEAVARAEEIMSHLGTETETRQSVGYWMDTNNFFPKALLYGIERYSNPVQIADPEEEKTIPIFARLYENRRERLDRRPLPLVLGAVALKDESTIDSGSFQVVKYAMEAGEPDKAQIGRYTSFVARPELIHYDPHDEERWEGLKDFMADIQLISERAGLE